MNNGVDFGVSKTNTPFFKKKKISRKYNFVGDTKRFAINKCKKIKEILEENQDGRYRKQAKQRRRK